VLIGDRPSSKTGPVLPIASTVPLLKGNVFAAPGCWPMMYEKNGEVEGETVVTLGAFWLTGVWMGSEGDPSELSDETEPERCLWW
jgi:hypothetical protein